MKHYRGINGIELSLRERLLTYIAQEISRHQSCTDLLRLSQLTKAYIYDVARELGWLERRGWIAWQRAGSLHNIHLIERNSYQQHPIRIVRAYRRCPKKN